MMMMMWLYEEFCPHLVWDVQVLIQKHLELADADV